MRTTLLTTLAALALAAPAAAQQPGLPLPTDPAFDVSAGQVEHTVTTVRVTGTNAVPSHQRHEVWMSRNRTRSVSTDLTTGRVRAETTYDARSGLTRTWSAEEDRIVVSRSSHPPLSSFRFEAAVQAAYLRQGITRVVGERSVNGRRALVTVNVPARWRSDRPDGVTTAVVDAETHVLYERSTELPDGEFRQVATHDVTEVLPASRATSAKLVMRRHRGARVTRR
jgi:hypothetical protein